MKKMHLLPALTVSAAMLFAVGCASSPSLQDMRNKMFSQEKVDAIHSAKIVYSISGDAAKADQLMIRSKGKNYVRFDLTGPGFVAISCLNHGKGWGYDPKNGSYAMTSDETKELIEDVSFLPLRFRVKKLFKTPKFEAEELLDEVSCYKFSATPLNPEKENRLVSLWFEKETGYLRRIEFMEDEDFSFTDFRDYKDFDGIKLATSIYTGSPEGLRVLTLQTVEWNAPIPDSIFNRPAPMD